MKPLIFTVISIALMFAGEPATQPAAEKPPSEKVVTPSGLTIITLAHGEGARKGDTVYIVYTGMLASNKMVFDATSLHNGPPPPITLGTGAVIKGWDEGIVGMQVGEKRHLIIPPELGYGKEGRGDKIPPDATIEFDMELVGLVRG